MSTHLIFRTSLLALATAGAAVAQNDECATAVALALNTPTAYDTTAATTSAPAWPCALNGGPDL